MYYIMWKVVVIVCALYLSTVETVPTPGRGALKVYCNTNADCKKNQCCVRSTNWSTGKRDISDHHNGKCMPHGETGSDCLVRDFSSLVKDIYFLSCPCSDGLNCKGEGRNDIPLGELSTCVKPCFTSDDCGRFECCVSLTHPIGKRSADLTQAPGECEPLGKNGTVCLLNNGSGRPDGIVFKSCPCKKRLTCVGSGDITIPLGESGVCQKLKKKR